MAAIVAPIVALGACNQPSGGAPQAGATATPPAPVPVVPFPQAVSNAANAVFSTAASSRAAGSTRYAVVIDPLIDGVSGAQSRATQSIQDQITALVQQRYPQFAIERFSAASLNTGPLVLVGTFTPVNSEGKTAGTREAYRFCLVMGDLTTGTIVAKGVARAQLAGVDDTPLPVFVDSPAWSDDRSSQGYINTCQASKVGDPINKDYLDGILTAAMISQAIEAYDNGRYADALNLYTSAAKTPAGDQLRVYNGIYLSEFKLGRPDTDASFGQLVDFGFRKSRLAVMILFSPGTTTFDPTAEFSRQYDSWLDQIARRAAQGTVCLDVVGNTSASGAAALNERLSELRAQVVKSRLDADAPQISARIFAQGVGSREMLVGTGKDDASDALDRRVEFKVRPSC